VANAAEANRAPTSEAASSGRRGHRAISGPLAAVSNGQLRVPRSIGPPSSAALTGLRHTPSKLELLAHAWKGGEMMGG
jgi:hypothetical protein